MKTRLLLVPFLIAATAALAACGGGGGGSSANVPADAVAVVGATPITKIQFNAEMQQANSEAKAQGQPVAKVGTPQYTQLRDRVIGYLVQVSELQQEAPKVGVTVTQKEVNAYLKNIRNLHYNGSEKKLEAAITKSGLTLAEAEQQVKVNLLAQNIQKKVTAKASVSVSQIKAYYHANKTQYQVGAATTRNVAHILVKSKSLADRIEQKLKNGASFASLAKKYSTDQGSAQKGGKLCVAKTGQSGSCFQTVAPFAKVAFSLKTGQISAPVHSQYGWHIIEALGPVKNSPAQLTPFSKVKDQIRSQLLQQQQQALWSAWLAKLQKDFQDKVHYQAGYAPPPTTALPTTGVSTVQAPTTTG